MSGTGPVIAGLDFTCPSIDAAGAAARLAARLRTRLLLVHAVPRAQMSARWCGDVESIAHQEATAARTRLEPLIAALRAIAPVEVRIEIGAIVPTLVHAGEDMPTALLVLGRGVRAHPYGVPGAIATRMLAQAHVPLLLAPPST
jgi:hypothetical protein